MIVCSRRAALLSSLLTADLFLFGCLPPLPSSSSSSSPPLLLTLAHAAEAATTTMTSATDDVDAPSYFFTVPTPTTWLPPMANLHTDDMVWKDIVTCCRYRQSQSQTCNNNDGSKTCTSSGTTTTDTSSDFELEPIALGRLPQFTEQDSLYVLKEARQAWDNGNGVWPQMTLRQRCKALRQFLQELIDTRREEMVTTLMLEIGKNRVDAESEFDRTMDFCRQVIAQVETSWQTFKTGTTSAFVRRTAIGVFLSLAPFNYPLNECYAAIIPCLLMGNVVILKLPTIGGLVHLWTMEAFAKTLPAGVINFIAGPGRTTMPPLMATGHIDGLAFIGGSKAADDLIQKHPQPHRLKVFLQLEANNMAIFLPEVFSDPKLLATSLDQTVLGTLSYNGQRCTALKLLFVPQAHADLFVSEFASRVQALNVGLADQKFSGGSYSQITPLPSKDRIDYMQALIHDATSKGAAIVNHNGGKILGGPESTLMVPAVLYPVTPNMRIYNEEQFGPVVPIVAYDNLEMDVLQFAQDQDKNPFGQQVSIFGTDADTVATIVDRFSTVFGRINLNTQCARSPDTVPFTGRRSSAMGIMSVSDIVREMSVPTVLAYSNTNPASQELVKGLRNKSNFLQPAVIGASSS